MLIVQSCPTLCDPMDRSPLASLSMEFSRQEYWSGSSFPSPEDLPDPGIEPGSPALQVDSLPPEPLLKHHQLINNITLKDFLQYVFKLLLFVTLSFSFYLLPPQFVLYITDKL